jgi:hypothetical protein
MRIMLVLGLLAFTACAFDDGLGEGGSTDEGDQNPDPHATFRTSAQFAETCGEGASAVRLVATRVDCVVPTPCTKQTNPYLAYEGDTEACPFEGEVDVSVEVLQSGKYRVDLVGTLDGGDELRICQGIGMVDKHLVTTDDLDARTEWVVSTLDGTACPIP